MRIILFLLLSAVIMVNCSSPARSIEEVVAMDKEIHLGIITYTDYFPFFIQYKNIGEKDLLIENIDTGCGCIINETFSSRWYQVILHILIWLLNRKVGGMSKDGWQSIFKGMIILWI